MRQILFKIPTPWFDIPIYAFGTLLVLALFVCVWVATRRAVKVGIPKEYIQDMALWLVIGGVLGARIVYMIQYGQPLSQFFRFWEGGLVFYGSAIGGVLGYLGAYWVSLRKYHIPWRKVADVVAPATALGLCIGRLGCLFNGCCYGNVACAHCPEIRFPISAFSRYELVGRGYQTAAGFSVAERDDPLSVVDRVEAGLPAEQAGLKPGDVIVEVDGQKNHRLLFITGKQADLTNFAAGCPAGAVWSFEEAVIVPMLRIEYDDAQQFQADHTRALARGLAFERVVATDTLWVHLVNAWPRGKSDLTLKVRRGAVEEDVGPFTPRTLGLHPTQIYETISTGLLFLLLTAYYPFKRRDGSVMALLMVGYAIHRYLNELLRNDTSPVALGMTLSQNISLLILLSGLGLALWLRTRPVQYPAPA